MLSLTVRVVVVDDVSLEIMLWLDCEDRRLWDFVFIVGFDAARFSGLTLGGLLLSEEEMFRSS